MTTNFQKLKLLLWKNYVIQKRHKWQTILELIVPLFFTIVIVIIRGNVSSETVTNATHFPPMDIASPQNTALVLILLKKIDMCYILFAPQNAFTDQILNDIKFFMMLNISLRFQNVDVDLNESIKRYESEAKLIKEYKNFSLSCGNSKKKSAESVIAAVVFNSYDWRKTNIFDYSIRFPATLRDPTRNLFGMMPRWMTELLYPLIQIPGPRDKPLKGKNSSQDLSRQYGGTPGYWFEGFLFFQQAIEKVMRRIMSNSSNLTNERIILSRMPYPSYIDDTFIIVLQRFLPRIFVYSFVYSVINITRSVAHEKEKRLKESMKMMGLPNFLHWISWFIKCYLYLALQFILMVILMKIKFYKGGQLAVLTYSDFSMILLLLMVYGFSIVTFSFFMSTLFSTANSAATAAGVVFFLSFMPFSFLQRNYDAISKEVKLVASLLSNSGLAFGCQLIGMLEGTGEGLQWSNIANTAAPDDNITCLDILIMLFFDGFLYLILALYIEGVWPGEYGLPLPFYFPFTKSYWLGIPHTKEILKVNSTDIRQERPEYFEPEPAMTAGVQIQGLTKMFGPKIAVNNLYLNMYDNQITVLLGHNGAGKTTTLSMLTGLFPPSSGTALVNGYDIRHDMKLVRESLGICPQHDVLFDELTVKEHLTFFALLKGSDNSTVASAVDKMLTAINLHTKKDTQAKNLSGGMKRRLSAGIAFIGGSRVVLLDEPSSGLDPGARRQIWDLIQREKKDRTIILSTHFMDEADYLGERIAIMAEGKVRCCGSSLYLKKTYGGGYHLIIVKETNCNVDNITNFLQRTIPNINVEQNVASELSYSLPEDMSHLFADMFEELEKRRQELGISSYGVSITTMEEVFMRVGKQVEDEMTIEMGITKGENEKNVETNDSILYRHLDRNYGMELFWQQMWAMIVKKFLYVIRNKILLAVQNVVPILFLVIILLIQKSAPNIKQPASLEINFEKYKERGNKLYTVMQCERRTDFCEAYEKFVGQHSSVINTTDVEKIIIQKAKENPVSVNYGFIVAMSTEDLDNRTTIKGWFNSQPYHSPPLALNIITNSLLRSNAASKNRSIKVRNFPLPLTAVGEVNNLNEAQSTGFQIGFTIAFGMSFVAASFVVCLVKERETNAKHLQVISGVRYSVFWIATLAFDTCNYIIPCVGLLIILWAFQIEDFSNTQMRGFAFLTLMMYGVATLPLTYLISFAFTRPSTAFTFTSILHILTGIITILAVGIMQIPDLGLVHVANILEWLFLIFPNFNLGYGLIQLSLNYQFHKLCPKIFTYFGNLTCRQIKNTPGPDQCCIKYEKSYLGFEPVGIGRYLLAQFIIGAVSFFIIVLLESKILKEIQFIRRGKKATIKQNSSAIEDPDVATENVRIRETNLTKLFETDNLILRDLTKRYGSLAAVNKLCLGVQKGECFGLLGINGAGKSTTFKMITGDISITSGDAFVCGTSVREDIKKVQRQLGYCPQFDSLIPQLTGRETIRLFARLRGVKEKEIDDLANALASKLLFSQHIDKQCGKYSGGNKRKLSTAVSLVGNPPIVLLDEPSSGMDPVARRHLWDAISDVRAAGTSVILTSHSMDECEALCTRLSIMVNGKCRCLGSTQHLKSNLGNGYTLVIQFDFNTSEEQKPTKGSSASELLESKRNSVTDQQEEQQQQQVPQPPPEQELIPLKNYIEQTFPESELVDIHTGFLHYHITDPNITWGYMFKKMEEIKKEYKINSYSIGQSTLEQIFLRFSGAQVTANTKDGKD